MDKSYRISLVFGGIGGSITAMLIWIGMGVLS